MHQKRGEEPHKQRTGGVPRPFVPTAHRASSDAYLYRPGIRQSEGLDNQPKAIFSKPVIRGWPRGGCI